MQNKHIIQHITLYWLLWSWL